MTFGMICSLGLVLLGLFSSCTIVGLAPGIPMILIGFVALVSFAIARSALKS